jgi:FtsP/CotA-like multicopper oxidase with cupredoxin domain
VKKILFTVVFSLLFISHAFASDRVVNLVVGYKTVYFAGKVRQAMAVNDQIPAPTLHFKKGDHVTII